MFGRMTDDERREALLDLADPTRTADPEATSRLVVLGLAVKSGRGHQPTAAGWVLLGDRGRPFNP